MAVKRKKPPRRTMQTIPNLFDVAREKEPLGSSLTVRRLTGKYGMNPILAAAYAELHGFAIWGADE